MTSMLRRTVVLRGPIAAHARLLATSAKPELINKSLEDGVLTIKFANEKKLNAWTMPLMSKLFSTLQEAERIEDLKETVVGRASRSQQQLEERLRAGWRRLCGTWRVEGTHGNHPPTPSSSRSNSAKPPLPSP